MLLLPPPASPIPAHPPWAFAHILVLTALVHVHLSAGSGFITFDELQTVVRNTLHKDSSVLSDSKLQQLWCSLDADNSNQVVPEEFGKFLRRSGGFIKAKGPDNLNKRSIELGGAQTAGLGRALESTPTAELRAKLEAPLGEDELTELSQKLCEWLAESLRAQSKSIHSWYNLFNDADLDGDGVITLDEFQNVVRLRLKKGSSELSDDKLHALWCHLDADDSNEILPQEMSKFLKRNLQKSRGQENLNKRTIELGGAQTAGLGRALESTPTAEMRAKLEAPLTEDQMLGWAKQFCKWLEMSLYKKNLSVHTWFNLFSEIDEDGSGFVTFDEFEDVVRHRLGQSVKKVPDETVRAIWCALDTDDSNQIMPQEMGKWLKQGADEVTSKAPKNLNKRTIELGGAQTAGLGRALESTPTAEMRAKLEAPLTEAELDDLSKKVTSWLEELMYKKNMATHSWFNLFKEADEDGMAHTAQPLQSTRTCAVSLCVSVHAPHMCAPLYRRVPTARVHVHPICLPRFRLHHL